MQSCGAPYIESIVEPCFSKSQKDLRCVGLILKVILKKAEAMGKSIYEQKAEFAYLFV